MSMSNTDDLQPSLKDVFEQVRCEEPRPDRAAMLRWQARYPKYSRELVDFFLNWALQDIRAGNSESVVADDHQTAAKGAANGARP